MWRFLISLKSSVTVTIALAMLVGCQQDSSHLALGTLERERIALTATANEVIISIPIATGALVNKGELLVQLDARQQQAQVDKAKAEVAQAQASLEKLRNGARHEEVESARAKVAGAKASLTEFEANYTRTKNLLVKRLVSQAELDKALSSRDAGQAILRAAQEQLLELTNGTREEDLRYAEAHVNGAKAMLSSEQKKLADLSVVATRTGRVDNLPWNLGERVTIGSPVVVIVANDAPFARVYIPEPYRIKLRIDDKLIIRVDGLERRITGTLKQIASEPAFTPYYALNQSERSRLVYLAEIQLPESESQLPSGVPVQVEMP